MTYMKDLCKIIKTLNKPAPDSQQHKERRIDKTLQATQQDKTVEDNLPNPYNANRYSSKRLNDDEMTELIETLRTVKKNKKLTRINGTNTVVEVRRIKADTKDPRSLFLTHW